MESNLDKFFKNNKELENEGVWLEVSDGVRFLVRRFGGANSSRVKAAMAKYYKPYARLIELGSMSDEKEKEIMVRVFIDACMVDWQGVKIDGVAAPYEKETAVKFFLNLPELLDSISAYATDSKSYREELGNS